MAANRMSEMDERESVSSTAVLLNEGQRLSIQESSTGNRRQPQKYCTKVNFIGVVLVIYGGLLVNLYTSRAYDVGQTNLRANSEKPLGEARMGRVLDPQVKSTSVDEVKAQILQVRSQFDGKMQDLLARLERLDSRVAIQYDFMDQKMAPISAQKLA